MDSPRRHHLIVYINGQKHYIQDAQPQMSVLEYLREIGLTGTKLGCGEGGCGACTVMVSKWDPVHQSVYHYSVNACLAPLFSVDWSSVTTVEALGDPCSGLHPLQKRLAEFHGSQCGFCTPGIVMAFYSLLRANDHNLSMKDIEQKFDGNLCRCTGYRPILDAAKTFANDVNSQHCCAPTSDIEDLVVRTDTCSKLKASACNPPVCDVDIPFPEALKQKNEQAVEIQGERIVWYNPSSLDELLQLKQTHMDVAKIVTGNTEVGIEMKFKHRDYPTLISVSNVKELHELKCTEKGIYIGAAVTLSKLDEFLTQNVIPTHEAHQIQSAKAIHHMLEWFASTQIRNVASIGGNIATASPISDLNPLLLSIGAVLTMQSKEGGIRQVQMSSGFFQAYRKIDMASNEVLISIVVPFSRPNEYMTPFKQAKRRDDDISIVTSGMRVLLNPQDQTVLEVSLAFGGMGPTTKEAKATCEYLVHQKWTEETVLKACEYLTKDMYLPDNVPGGMAAFRQTLCASFLYKFYLSTIGEKVPSFVTDERPLSKGFQQYPTATEPLLHQSAYGQVSGKANYTDDIPMPATLLHCALVLSTIPHGTIKSVDPSKALKVEGVVGYFSAKDIRGNNKIGPVVKDEECFLTTTVTSVGQVIGIIAADSLEIAQRAVQQVQVEYHELPSILTIHDAIEANAFHTKPHHRLQLGNVSRGFEESDVVITGEMEIGAQEHFYLEPNSTLCIPDEERSMKVYCSTQNTAKTQQFVASVIGVPFHKVSCHVKRMGGGFGGKETRSIFVSCAAAVVADTLKRPVKLTLDRNVDMATTGTRHAFYGKYKLGATKDGVLKALEIQLYCNAGYSLDLSQSVMDRALFHCDNTYFIPNVDAVGHVCMTHTPSNTAFRGFGGPQGMMVCETYIEHLSSELNLPPHVIRQRNLYQMGQSTPYGQILDEIDIRSLWQRAMAKEFHFEDRLQQVNAFNAENRWKKRGISILPVKFGINFTAKFLNQGGALVHIYTDGSVLVSHGGTEMGQGLHTKVIQVVAHSFNIPTAQVRIDESATDKVPNASPSAASMSTDLYGMAALNACEILLERLEPVRKTLNGDCSFQELVQAAYFQRVNLSAQGFHITANERCGFDWETQTGHPFNYYTTGIGCTEIELDVLTGDYHMRKAEILMDVGSSINPAIDIGQIEGAFIQGFGLFAMEEIVYGDSDHEWVRKGHLFTQGPGTYKIPAANDVPLEFNVILAENKKNPYAVHSSKAIGEPPLFLGASAFYAARHAILAARKDAGHNGHIPLNSPLTPERARMACIDQFTAPFVSK